MVNFLNGRTRDLWKRFRKVFETPFAKAFVHATRVEGADNRHLSKFQLQMEIFFN